MSEKQDKDKVIRELPKSLQGIELILGYLNQKDKQSSSIRNISSQTNLSMRVSKNILLQLEKFNQVERVVDKNNILPKWRITKFGKKVVKAADGFEERMDYLSIEEELTANLVIYNNSQTLKSEIKKNHEIIAEKLNDLQIELTKLLGPILNIDKPNFEDLLSSLIKRIKSLKQIIIDLPSDPLRKYTITKKDQKHLKISKENERLFLVELHFFNSLILNDLKRVLDFGNKLYMFIEDGMFIKGHSVARDLREEIRLLNSLINNLTSIRIDYHIFTDDILKQIAKNKLNHEFLEAIIEPPMTNDEKLSEIKEIVLRFQGKLTKGDKLLEGHRIEITENMALLEFYHLLLDEKPNINLTIETLEQCIEALADEGYIPGILLIQEDVDHYIKLIQFKAHDISKDESELVKNAIKLQKFSLADIINVTGWKKDKILEILDSLTNLGVLKFSKSFLHGDRWYIVSENTI